MYTIYIYDPEIEWFKTERIGDYLREKFPEFNVELRGDFFNHFRAGEDTARALAMSRVRHPYKRIEFQPLYGEIEYEKRVLAKKAEGTGIIYDGILFLSVLQNLIPDYEKSVENIHLVFTRRIVATLNDRYHARVVLLSIPSVISVTGIVEGPAKPREFYIAKRKLITLGVPPEVLKEKFSGRFVDYGDARITEIAKGYAIQAIVHHISGEGFCQDKNCRLFNAHWQEDMIHAQLSEPEFCERHERLIKNIAEGRVDIWH